MEVPALKVRLIALAKVLPKLIAVFAESVMVPDPNVTVLELLFALVTSVAVKLYVLVSKAPFVTVRLATAISSALPSTHPHPTPFTVIDEPSDTPLVVNVLPVAEPDNVMLPTNVRVMPVAAKLTLP